ncbi:hypothetical protein I203_104694 [Kwoniella mangroviensis CBS 8507]|uniref:uncharacterized protein n=1 Tax=Kwoniella mangroviensis CBS 8507 TaxID=1296122 RepID=UPI00080CE0C5|nr:uncharacterized protein I203_00360 [Kwoniella mangroviensis CBS 8507]OCF70228.1 hypothetical protein I203_00360 [Kwoniella mangroviensis CBS 8507]
MRSHSTLIHQDEARESETNNRGNLATVRRKSSTIWSKAKEVSRKASIIRQRQHRRPSSLAGEGGTTSEEEWEIVTPPLGSSEFTQTPTTPSHSNGDDQEDMLDGARGTGTISRISQRAQQGSALDLLDVNSISSASHMTRTSSTGYSRSGSGSESGSGSGQRSLEVDLGNYQFPSPPTHIKQKRSWLEGGPLTVPEDREELERKLPDDHPFNSPHSSDQSHSHSRRTPLSHSASFPSMNERYNHLEQIFHSLNFLKEELYQHNTHSFRILSSFEDVLPPSIVNGINRRLDRYWNKWSVILNTAGEQISSSIISLQHRSFSSAQFRDPPAASRKDYGYLKSLIPAPLTTDEMERLIWTLEDSGKVASGTYRRMFGSKAKSRIMTPQEEREADEKGLRDWMVGETESTERGQWRRDYRGF